MNIKGLEYGNNIDEQSESCYPFNTLCREAKELYLTDSITILDNPPDPLTFYREFVAKNKPCIINNAINNWPALNNWNDNNYLKDKMGNKNITVDIVPCINGIGLADSVIQEYFVTGIQKQVRFNDFIDIITQKDYDNINNGVYYCQHQNNSFQGEFSVLSSDISIPSWINQSFGSVPDVINMWIGTNKSITSLHHDYYENIYAVITGTKHFILYPPTSFYFLNQEYYKKAHWEYWESDIHSNTGNVNHLQFGKFVIKQEECEAKVPWFNNTYDIRELVKKINCNDKEYKSLYENHNDNDDISDNDLLRYGNALHFSLEAGQLLYLPSMWYHTVAQSNNSNVSVNDPVIAVNFWYDMAYDLKYNYFRYMQTHANLKKQQINSNK